MPKPPAQTLQKIPVVRDVAAVKATRLELELEAVMRFGTPEQRARHRDCTLGEEEILQLVRAQLFKPFDQFSRWQKINPKEVHHTDRCAGWAVGRGSRDVADEFISFETSQLDEKSMNQYAWETLAAIRAAADIAKDHHWLTRSAGLSCGIVLVEPVTHRAFCRSCHAETARSSAKVSMVWGDRTLTREYAL
jgi:hypothetical protein